MTPDDIKVFKNSQAHIFRVQDEVGDMITRCKAALGSSTSLSVLKKTLTDEAQKKTIEGHIKEVEKLEKIAKTMRDEIKKLAEENPEKYPEKYFDMKALLNKHTAFFRSAEEFQDKATLFKQSLIANDKAPFYRGPLLKNVHMTIIPDKIESIVDHYQKMQIAYRKYKPYGPF